MQKLKNLLDNLIEFLRRFPVLNKIPVNFYRFFIIGLTVFAIDATIFSILWHVFGLQSKLELFSITENVKITFPHANMISLFISTIFGYIANKIWSFEDKSDNVTSQFIKYLLVAILNFTLNNIIMGILLYEIFAEQNDQFLITSACKVLATSFQTVSSYLLYKFVVFREEKEVISEATA